MHVSESLLGLPAFLRFLTTHPTPDDVTRALVKGPLAHVGSSFGTLRSEDGCGNLVLIGTYGWAPDEEERYRLVPLRLDTPTTRCYLEGTVIVTSSGTVGHDYPALGLDTVLWEGMRRRGHEGSVICMPVVENGVSIGTYGFITHEVRTWDSRDVALLEAVSAALGLWMSHPRTRVALPSGAASDGDEHPLALTERQRRILLLVEKGKTSPAIAAALGYSLSTVKQELHRSMRALRATDRFEAAARARELGLLADVPGAVRAAPAVIG